LCALLIAQTTSAEVGIQFVEVFDLRHGRCPILLQELHTTFDARLLLRPPHQAEQWLEIVMACQSKVTLVDLPAAAFKQMRHHRLGIVPPDFARHAFEEVESLDQAVQNRFGSLGRQGQGKWAIRVTPSHHQNRHLSSAVAEVNVDVTEVGLKTLPWIMVQWNKGLAVLPFLGTHVAPDALVTTAITMLLLQPPPQLLRGVPLLGRRLLIGSEDGVDNRLEWIQDRERRFQPDITLRFRHRQDLADLPSRMMEKTSQLADAQPVYKMCSADTRILVHRDHPSPPCSWSWCTSLQEVLRGWARFRRAFLLGGGSELDEHFQFS
jgi:hypothetical protein